MNVLLMALAGIVLFAIIAGGMKWICDNFFGGIQAAYWICGVILLFMLVYVASIIINGGPAFIPWGQHHS